jgi:hypothetical protein
MQKEIERGRAPSSIERVDRANPENYDRFDHIHFKDGRNALYNNGEWKHGGRKLTNAEKKWIEGHGWKLPKE